MHNNIYAHPLSGHAFYLPATSVQLGMMEISDARQVLQAGFCLKNENFTYNPSLGFLFIYLNLD